MKIFTAARKIIGFIRFYLNPVKYARDLGVKVGEDSTIMTWKFGSEPWLISIGNHVKITSNVRFITHDGGSWVFRDQEKYRNVRRYGKIEIRDNCFIGNSAIIMPDVKIGPNAVVGVGAVVTKDVPEGAVVVGVPAKVIMTVSEYAEKGLKNTLPYNMEQFNKNKKDEILRFID